MHKSHNADLIRAGIDKEERFRKLRDIADYQLSVLNEAEKVKALP